MYSKKLKTLVLELLQGDITDMSAGAIVNAANSGLWMGAGVAGAIRRKGGRKIETEAMEKGPVEIGGAMYTGAGTLPAKYIIHAVVMGQELTTSSGNIKAATASALALGDELKAETIVFPAFGTGTGGFGIKRCAEIMLGEIAAYDREKNRTIKRVSLALFTPAAFKVFEEIYRKI